MAMALRAASVLMLGGLVLFPTLNRVNQSQLDVLILFIDIKTCSAGLFEDTEVAGAEQRIVHYTVSRFLQAFA